MLNSVPLTYSCKAMSTWVVENSGYSGVKADVCQTCAELAYEWIEARSDEAGTFDLGEAKESCIAYVRSAFKTRHMISRGPLTSFIIWWCLETIISYAVSCLLDWLFSDKKYLVGFKAYAAVSKDIAVQLAKSKKEKHG